MTLKLTIEFRVQSEILESEYSGGDARFELGQVRVRSLCPLPNCPNQVKLMKLQPPPNLF
jgi:hypothetical protein